MLVFTLKKKYFNFLYLDPNHLALNISLSSYLFIITPNFFHNTNVRCNFVNDNRYKL